MTGDDYPLPYRLRRPFVTFFRRYSLAVLPVSLLAGLLGGTVLFLTALLIGASFWLGLCFAALAARQSITIYDDRLLFELAGRRHVVSYRDLSWVDVELVGWYSFRFWLWVAYTGAENRPLSVNFELFARRDRMFLLKSIAASAPHVALNEMAKDLAAGKTIKT